MDALSGEQRTILDWDEDEVHAWLKNIGFPQYETQIKEHNISGDVLCMLDPEGLKAVGVATVGQRLAILKGVYMMKIAHNIPIEPDDYIPPSEAQDRQDLTVEKLYTMIKALEKQILTVEEDNRYLRDLLQNTFDEQGIRTVNGSEGSPIQPQASFKWESYGKPSRSPTKPELESPHPSPEKVEHDAVYNITSDSRAPYPQASTPSQSRARPQPFANEPALNNLEPQSSSRAKPGRSESADNLKSFKVSLDDPTWKVLPAALKKYKIHNDNWQNYAMFICYGASGSRIERCLSYDEKPLLLFQKLKDAKKNPVFMLKHIKDIRSPIAVAQQKQAARKASMAEASTSSTRTSSTPAHGRAGSHPPKLELQDLSSGGPPLGAWPELMSPSIDKDRGDDINSVSVGSTAATVFGNGSSSSNGTPHSSSPNGVSTVVGESPRSRGPGSGGGVGSEMAEHAGSHHPRDTAITSTGISYAVAIYPYMAEQQDEFDVIVGDTFVILSRARGWWIVQRDPTGSGAVNPESSSKGWVPAGCLLETNIPVASAIAEATAAQGSDSLLTAARKTPILPLSIISTSYPGVALTDYTSQGEEELDLVKDETLRVFKRYNHWSYAVKEDGGDRGWVPSWFIGKVSQSGGTPSTPNLSAANSNVESDAQASRANMQVSPMSSAFPPAQTRS